MVEIDTRRMVGLGGVLLAAVLGQLNDQVATIAQADIAGALGLSHDPVSWLRTLFITGEVIGMSLGPSLGLIFSLRRFAMFAVLLSCLSSLAFPIASTAVDYGVFRFLQGLAAGLTIPLLMTTALRVLEPKIRLYGLAVYSLTATFTPNVATSIAGFWTDTVGIWVFVFVESLPIAAIALVMIWWGMKQDQPQWDRLRHFDWRGALLLAIGFGSLAIVLQQGTWLDWYNSKLICTLTLVTVVAVPLFLLNESRATFPLIRLDLLLRRNFAYAAITLIVFLVVTLSASRVPLTFLEQVRGYRPIQAGILTTEVALSQLLLLPAAALLLDLRWLDSRWMSAAGFACIIYACYGCAHVDSQWTRSQFYYWEAFQSIGSAFVVMPLLMMATNAVTPQEGPYASALVNTPRAIAEALGAWVVGIIGQWRGTLHRDRILDLIGQSRLGAVGAHPTILALQAAVQRETDTLNAMDSFIICGALAAGLMVILAILPVRTYPPRIALAKK